MPTPAPYRRIHPLRIELLKRGTSAAQLARTVGYSPNTLHNVMRGNVASWPKLRSAISAELGVDERRLFPETRSRLSPGETPRRTTGR